MSFGAASTVLWHAHLGTHDVEAVHAHVREACRSGAPLVPILLELLPDFLFVNVLMRLDMTEVDAVYAASNTLRRRIDTGDVVVSRARALLHPEAVRLVEKRQRYVSQKWKVYKNVLQYPLTISYNEDDYDVRIQDPAFASASQVFYGYALDVASHALPSAFDPPTDLLIPHPFPRTDVPPSLIAPSGNSAVAETQQGYGFFRRRRNARWVLSERLDGARSGMDDYVARIDDDGVYHVLEIYYKPMDNVRMVPSGDDDEPEVWEVSPSGETVVWVSEDYTVYVHHYATRRTMSGRVFGVGTGIGAIRFYDDTLLLATRTLTQIAVVSLSQIQKAPTRTLSDLAHVEAYPLQFSETRNSILTYDRFCVLREDTTSDIRAYNIYYAERRELPVPPSTETL